MDDPTRPAPRTGADAGSARRRGPKSRCGTPSPPPVAQQLAPCGSDLRDEENSPIVGSEGSALSSLPRPGARGVSVTGRSEVSSSCQDHEFTRLGTLAATVMSPLRHMAARRALRERGHDSSVADTSTQKLKTVLACRMPTFAPGTQRRGPYVSHRSPTPGAARPFGAYCSGRAGPGRRGADGARGAPRAAR